MLLSHRPNKAILVPKPCRVNSTLSLPTSNFSEKLNPIQSLHYFFHLLSRNPNLEKFSLVRIQFYLSRASDKWVNNTKTVISIIYESFWVFINRSHVHLYLFFRFTQNLSVFRRDVNDSLKAPGGSSPSPSPSLDMMNCGWSLGHVHYFHSL